MEVDRSLAPPASNRHEDSELDSILLGVEEEVSLPRKKVPGGDVYEAARAGDVDRLRFWLEQGVNVNARDAWDSGALYYACLAGHLDAALLLLENGAICSEHTFDGDRCHYAALTLRIRKLLKAFESRPPPLQPLARALREVFIGVDNNSSYADESLKFELAAASAATSPDVVFFVAGRPLGVHRAILAARSPFFRQKFASEWRHRREIRLAARRLNFAALFSLFHFFYSDRLDVAVEDMEDLVRICKVCRCRSLQLQLEKELVHQKYAEYKSVNGADASQRRYILQGSELSEEDTLPAAMRSLFLLSLANSSAYASAHITNICGNEVKNGGESRETCWKENCEPLCLSDNDQGGFPKNLADDSPNKTQVIKGTKEPVGRTWKVSHVEACNDAVAMAGPSDWLSSSEKDYADVCFLVSGKLFRSHKFILAARSEYFEARFSRADGFQRDVRYLTEGLHGVMPVLEEHDIEARSFQMLLEFVYTDKVETVDCDQAEKLFDAASRYLLFGLKRAVAAALLPQLETASPAELCNWLLLADMYGVWKLREHCLDVMALDFELFASTPEFRQLVASVPPPSGELSHRTTAPSAPGQGGNDTQENILDDLREKWLAIEGQELDKRDASALEFDTLLQQLLIQAKIDAFDLATEDLVD